jgi:hypothetical protein
MVQVVAKPMRARGAWCGCVSLCKWCGCGLAYVSKGCRVWMCEPDMQGVAVWAKGAGCG